MARSASVYLCQACGHRHAKWVGRCEGCHGWNTLVEEAAPSGASATLVAGGRALQYASLSTSLPLLPRLKSGIEEFDRVCGGGLVPGSVILLGGDPGIGKSTILLQVTAKLAQATPTVYLSGEESAQQIQLRAQRLQLANSPVKLATETNMAHILATLEQDKSVQVVIVDSIQTLFSENLESAAGTVSQVRACAHALIQFAKKRNCVVILVGHVTKEGTLAGPKVLEHMVDTVLYFEGERGHHFRILRAVKNRFGPCNEIGVFEMTDQGLQEISNPSALFLAERQGEVSGASVFAGMEGSRPLLVEIQALVAPCTFGAPRRAVVGWDQARLSMLLAVLEARCGIGFGNKDVFLNIAGGIKITEPAADLAAAAAVLSALSGLPCPEERVLFGEIGLSGEVRNVSAADMRLKEAAKLGFKGAFIPKQRTRKIEADLQNFKVYDVADIKHLVTIFAKRKAEKGDHSS